MVVQAIALLDDLDKEVNIYSMRVKVRRAYNSIRHASHCVNRNGMGGTFLRWARLLSITLLMHE